MTKLPVTPEHDKLFAVQPQSEIIGQFLEWLASDGVTLARWDQHVNFDVLHPDYEPIQQRLARYFGIDLATIEQEKRAILAGIRAANSA